MEAAHGAELVKLLEAIYSLELDDQTWLRDVVTALAALCGSEHHYVGFFYDASDVNEFKVWNVCQLQPVEVESAFRRFLSLRSPDLVRTTFRSLRVGSARRTAPVYLASVLDELADSGWGDILNINGLDQSGIGCNLGVGCRAPEFRLTPNELAVFQSHVPTAFRCRQRLGVGEVCGPVDRKPEAGMHGAEAVLDTHGRFIHATGLAATKTAQARIRDAAASIDSVRGSGERQCRRGRGPMDVWHPLTAARWTLVDAFEEDGRRYVVARENQVQAHMFASLTDRERQVVVQAALGLTNKEIAYALGISDATVRVLMARAANRIGVHTRDEMLAHPSVQSLRPATIEQAPSARARVSVYGES